jgi:seryl-tRNA synthetase
MLQTTYLRDNRQEALDRLAKRGFDATAIVDEIIALDDKRKSTQTTLDSILAESNKLAKEIGDLFKQGKSAEANVAKQRTVELKEQSSELQDVMQATEAALLDKLYQLPNTPHSSVPKGKTAEDNETVSEHGQMPKLPENALPHWELAKKYGIIDFEMGVKVTGAGFPVYAGQGARLQRALINFFLDEAHKAGYKEYIPPFMVNQASGYGTGQLPDKEGQMYYMPADDFYMVPTAEVPLTNFFRDVIVKAEELPVKLTAYTPCFRREAGSYGKDVKGLNRLHQFDKVEIVQVAHPDKSYAILEDMVKHVTGSAR